MISQLYKLKADLKLYKVKAGFKQVLAEARHRILRICADLKLVRLTAYIVRREIVYADSTDTEATKYKIIVLMKSGLIEDIRESLLHDKEFCIGYIERRVIKNIAKAFLPEDLGDDSYMVTDEETGEQKTKYRQFLYDVFNIVNRKEKIDCFITGNYGYYAERELGNALRMLNIKFVAMHKESLKSPGRQEFFEKVYKERRGKFTGDAILVYNETEKRVQVAAQVAEPNRIIVTGMPRMDPLHRWKKEEGRMHEAAGKKIVLFFFFSDIQGLPYLDGGGYPLKWSELNHIYNRLIIELSKDYQDIEFVVKTKNKGSSKIDIEKYYRNEEIPQNLKIVIGGDPHEYIRESTVVCGFNTTAVLEAIAAYRPVVVPNFAEATKEEYKEYVLDYENAVDYANSQEQMREMILSYCGGDVRSDKETRDLVASREDILKKWVNNADGKAGERVRETIKRLLAD